MWHPDVKKRFGLAIKNWRAKSDISQEELAWRAGLHRSYVADIERGVRNASLQSIEKLANALKVSLSVLFQPLGDQPNAVGAPPEGDEPVDILLVEDDRNDVELTLLAFQQYQVLEAATGMEAIQVWEQHGEKVDLLLTDLVMPDGVSGRELAKSLETRESSLRVIYTSGHAPETRETVFVFRGGINFLQKPYQAQTLAKAIRDCLDKT